MAKRQHAKRQGKVSGISKAALKGAKAGERPEPPQEDNASTMARPQPGMIDPRSGRTTSGAAGEAEAHSSSSEVTGFSGQAQEDDDQEWRRAGGGAPD